MAGWLMLGDTAISSFHAQSSNDLEHCGLHEGEGGLNARNAIRVPRSFRSPLRTASAVPTARIAAGAIIALEPSQIERPGSPSMTCWRSKGRSPAFQSDAVWTTR